MKRNNIIVAYFISLCIITINIMILLNCEEKKENNSKDIVSEELEKAVEEINTKAKKESKTRLDVINLDKSSYDPKTGELLPDEFTVLLWRFNGDDPSFVEDESGNEINGLISEGELQKSLFKKGLFFNAKNTEVKADFNPILNLKKAVTVELWVYMEEIQKSEYPVFIARDTSTVWHGFPTYEFYLGNDKDTEIKEFNKPKKRGRPENRYEVNNGKK